MKFLFLTLLLVPQKPSPPSGLFAGEGYLLYKQNCNKSKFTPFNEMEYLRYDFGLRGQTQYCLQPAKVPDFVNQMEWVKL